jgi:hypothetical protein
MSENKSLYKAELLKMSNQIDENIIFSYQLLKNNDFYRAWKNEEPIVSSSGQKDIFCFKEISVIENKLLFKFRTLASPFAETSYDNRDKNASMINDAINTFNQKGQSYIKLNQYLLRASLEMYCKKETEIENLTITKFGAFQNLADFVGKEHDDSDSNRNTYIVNLLNIFSALPSEIVKAHKEFNYNNNQITDKEKELVLDKLKNNLDAFRNQKDYMVLYESNPSFFLKAFRELEKQEKEKIVINLIKNKTYKDKKKIDDLFSEEFGDLIAETFRKNV